MRIFAVLLLSLANLFGQGASTVGPRNPSVLMSSYRAFSSNEIYALSPDWWYMSSVGVTTNGATPTDGQRIDSWLDLSGNARHLGQDQTSYRPTYFVNALNGFPVVGIAKFNNMTNPFAVSLKQPGALFSVLLVTNDPNVHVLTYSTAGGRWTAFFAAGSMNPSFASATSISGDVGLETVKWHLLSIVFDGAATGYASQPSYRTRIYLNMKKTIQGDSGTNSTGTGVMIGNDTTFSIGLQGRLAEIIQFSSRRFTDSMKVGVELYLETKYGLGHPF